MRERHARFPQPAQIELRPAPMQVIESRDAAPREGCVFRASATLDPTKPAPPVTRMR